MIRKIIFACAVLVGMAGTLNGATKAYAEADASDGRFEYIGRTLVSGGDVSYDWSGVYVRVRFTGTELSVRCTTTGDTWFNLWNSSEFSPREDARFHVKSCDTTLVLVKGLRKGEHEIILQKRTEGEQGKVTLHSFSCDGEFLQSNRRKERHIEFIGDSYTCGYGTESESRDDPFKAATENCNLTYAAIASRYFDADFNLVSHSGQGICRNYDDYRPGYAMPERYLQTFDMDPDEKWDAKAAAYTPDVVVIYLCTNDFSTGRQPHLQLFVEKYCKLLHSVAENYGEDIPVVCMASNANPLCADYVRKACIESGLKNAVYMSLSKGIHNETSELGASWHPNYKGQRKVASCAIPYISTVTGWEMKEAE
ncbi:MAG: SGNH/GDSL hydrolase family protein [Candidatus Cryptobacteroides sp.]